MLQAPRACDRIASALTVQGVELSGMSKNSVSAPGRQRAASGRGAFPLRAARLVEMQMHVDQAGKHVQSASVDFFGGARKFGTDRGDLAVFDRDILAVASPLGSPASGMADASSSSRNRIARLERGRNILEPKLFHRDDG